MTEREEVANKLQRLIAAYKAFKRVRNDYPAIGREGVTAAIIAEIDRNLAEIRHAGEPLQNLVATCDALSAHGSSGCPVVSRNFL